MALRIYVDFNTMTTDPQERVYLNTHMRPDLAQGLRSGSVVTLYDEEMEVEAGVEFDEQDGIWLGQPDWSTRRDLSFPTSKTHRPA